MTNDTLWAHRILSPESRVRKTYHVQIDRHPDEALLAILRQGTWSGDEFLSTESVHVLRLGEQNAWLEICLTQGRNRQIRRLLEATGCCVLRLVRVAVGPLQLGSLGKGETRLLTPEEVAGLRFKRSDDETTSELAGQRTCKGASNAVLEKPARIQAVRS
jgi:23S rRNA pseudouridine2605 synthase